MSATQIVDAPLSYREEIVKKGDVLKFRRPNSQATGYIYFRVLDITGINTPNPIAKLMFIAKDGDAGGLITYGYGDAEWGRVGFPLAADSSYTTLYAKDPSGTEVTRRGYKYSSPDPTNHFYAGNTHKWIYKYLDPQLKAAIYSKNYGSQKVYYVHNTSSYPDAPHADNQAKVKFVAIY